MPQVKRLLGSETDLRALNIEDGDFLRIFDPTISHYNAVLNELSDQAPPAMLPIAFFLRAMFPREF